MAWWAICKGKFLIARTFWGYLCNRRGRDNMDCGAKRGSVWFSCPGIWNTASLNAWHLEQIFSPSSATECSFERHADMRMYFHGWVPHRWLWPFTRTVSKLHGFLSPFVGLGNDMKWSQVGLAKKSYTIIIIYLSISRVVNPVLDKWRAVCWIVCCKWTNFRESPWHEDLEENVP